MTEIKQNQVTKFKNYILKNHILTSSKKWENCCKSSKIIENNQEKL